jgi:glucosamine--fructose-6-phosphate aminotransferase (isomerizing)
MYEEIQEEPEAIRKTINENADKINKVIEDF